jgi:hypothetical protein
VLLSLLLDIDPLASRKPPDYHAGLPHLRPWSIPEDHGLSFPLYRTAESELFEISSYSSIHAHPIPIRTYSLSHNILAPNSPISNNSKKTQTQTRVYSRLADILNHTEKDRRGKERGV